jgi:AraC family transcriptional regulator, regulatory protein of adaptative response / methylated-DNA-[protein]-cysteine methyltransferase
MIFTQTIDTPIGLMVAGAAKEGICLLEFTDRKMLNSEYKILRKYLNCDIADGNNDLLNNLRSELSDYFSGKIKEFSVPLIYTGTDFQKSVWDELIKIPFGTTRTYGEQAARLGNMLSVRAVAGANGMNKISILVPCHRVIGEDGNLTGYGGGLWRKKWLIEHEMKYSGRPTDLLLF